MTVSPVQVRTVRDWSDYTGRIEPRETVSVRARIPGFIQDMRFREGARVSRGAVLFTLDARPLQAEVDRLQAEANRVEAEAALARIEDARARRLLAREATAQAEVDRASGAAQVANARSRAAQAAVRSAQLQLDYTQVRAPITGRVSRAVLTAGNNVTPADEVTTIVSDDPVYAYFNADEATYLRFAATGRGQALPVFMGLTSDTGYPHRGRLDFLDNRVSGTSGTISMRGVFANGDGRFTPGLFARIRLLGADGYQAALVPERAIGVDLGQRYVLLVGADGKAARRTVTLGPAVDGWRLVRSGLRAGEQVIVDGLQKVQPGAPVRVTRREAPPRSPFLDEISFGAATRTAAARP